MRSILISLFLFFYGYAVVRYHLGKNVPWSDWYFILNKGFAWMGFTLVALTLLKEKTLNKISLSRRSLGLIGYFFLIAHVVSNLLLFNERHFPKLYHNGVISSSGWIAIILGIMAFVVFTLPLVATLKNFPSTSKYFRLGKIGVLTSIFHPTIIGFAGWLKPGTWPYSLPPIT